MGARGRVTSSTLPWLDRGPATTVSTAGRCSSNGPLLSSSCVQLADGSSWPLQGIFRFIWNIVTVQSQPAAVLVFDSCHVCSLSPSHHRHVNAYVEHVYSVETMVPCHGLILAATLSECLGEQGSVAALHCTAELQCSREAPQLQHSAFLLIERSHFAAQNSPD